MDTVTHNIIAILSSISGIDKSALTMDMSLIGDGAILSSMQVVELCLALEDLASTSGMMFDWTSDVAMSKSRSMFRSVGSLIKEYQEQINSK